MQDTVPEMPVAQLDLVRHDDGRFRPPTMQAPWADRFQTLEKIKAQAVLSDHDRRAAGRNNLAGGGRNRSDAGQMRRHIPQACRWHVSDQNCE